MRKVNVVSFPVRSKKKAVSEETAFNNLLKYKSNLC
jgi:hypothetical protein